MAYAAPPSREDHLPQGSMATRKGNDLRMAATGTTGWGGIPETCAPVRRGSQLGCETRLLTSMH